MKKKVEKTYENFNLIDRKKISEIDSEIFVFEHKILKTKIIFIKNSDKEKAFTVCFKTPSPDSKGYQHILEHSVLRSSEKYDFGNKEVFTDILKKSSLTFLNAATYDDKTIYPFSTILESEFFKVMDIYTDAVLNPLCVKNENYFRQEGHRVEKDQNKNFFINGVVFNEMKGRLSDRDCFLHEKKSENLFKDTEYKFNAGGNPNEIIDLKFSEFVKYHKDFYHPTNATFLVYGDVDIEKFSQKLEADFLVNFKKGKKAPKTKVQKKFRKIKHEQYFFPSSAEDEKGQMSISFVANKNSDIEQSFINTFIIEILTDQKSFLYKKIMDSGLAQNFTGFYETDILQTIFDFSFDGVEKKNFKKLEKLFLKL